MNEETLWVLKMLSEKRLTAQMANRLLRAVELLEKSEESKRDGVVIAVVSEPAGALEAKPDEMAQAQTPEEELEGDTEQDSVSKTTQEIPENTEPGINYDFDEELEPEEPLMQEIIAEDHESVEDPIKQDLMALNSTMHDPVDSQEKAEEAAESAKETALEISPEVEEIPSEKQIFKIISTDVSPEEPSFEFGNFRENQQEELESIGKQEEDSPEIGNFDDDSEHTQPDLLNGEVSIEEFEEEIEKKEQISEDVSDIEQDQSEAVDEPITMQEKSSSWEKEEPIIAEREFDSQDQDDNKQDVFMLPIADDTEIIFNNGNSNITIYGWEEEQLKVEGSRQHINVLQEDNKFDIDIDGSGDFSFHIPPSVTKVRLFGASGEINIDNHKCDMFVSSSTGDIYVKNSSGSLKAKTIGGNIAVEEYKGDIRLQSESGSILARKIADDEDSDKANGLSKSLKSIANKIIQTDKKDSEKILEVDIQTESGDIALEDIEGSINIKGNGEIIRLKRCRGQNIAVESTGGKINLKDVATRMNLKVENGELIVEDFFGSIKIDAKDTDLTLMKSGDAQIHIDSDGGNIKIEDCYADASINSDKGNIYIAGGNLSFAGMGRTELKIKNGNAYLARRTFENLWISIENGNAEVNMEKLNSGGLGNITVHEGDIRLRVSPSFQFDLTAQVSKKKLHLDLPIEVIERDKNYLRGTLNNGGVKVNLAAPKGEIFIQALAN